MNSNDQCTACGGGGLVLGLECTCGTNAHTCPPAICTACDGTGAVKA